MMKIEVVRETTKNQTVLPFTFKSKKIGLHGIRPEILIALFAVSRIWNSFGVTPVITSANDGRHSFKSLHFSGAAIDIRTSNLPRDSKAQAINDLRECLRSVDFDIVLENEGGRNEHLHIEFQPKDRSPMA